MIIKVILIIFAYLLVGIAVLEWVLWLDRKTSSSDKWINEEDDWEQSLVVVSWPVMIPILGIYILYLGLKYLIKGVRIFFTAIVYLIAAIIDKNMEDKKK